MTDENRSPSNNPQIAFRNFKESIKKIAQTQQKTFIPKINQSIKTKQVQMEQILNDTNIKEKLELQITAAMLQKHIIELEKKTVIKANWYIKGETISKYWSKLNKDPVPRDTIYQLKNPNTGQMMTRSDEMAEASKNYHKDLQRMDVEEGL